MSNMKLAKTRRVRAGSHFGVLLAALCVACTSAHSCLSPQFLAKLDVLAPEDGAATRLVTLTNRKTGNTMKVPIKIALNGWVSAYFHSHLAKVRGVSWR